MKKTSFGTFFELGGRGAMEALTRTGLDYVIIDTEHGCLSVETTADMILAAENGGLLPYVRIGDTRRPYVLRMLDVGARGLIVPNIRSVEEVRRLVDAAKFPPLGNRGYCPTRTSGWGADEWARDAFSYMAACNERCKVIPQCETREALEQIEEIAALPGVDGIFVGPCDLSGSIGHLNEIFHPEVLALIDEAIAKCREAGMPIGVAVGANSEEDVRFWFERGFQFISAGSDISAIVSTAKKQLEMMRRVLKP